jgi:hypothetical protein
MQRDEVSIPRLDARDCISGQERASAHRAFCDAMVDRICTREVNESVFGAHVNSRRGNVCRNRLYRSNRLRHQRNALRITRSPLDGSSPRTRYTLTNQRHGFRSGYTRNWIVGFFSRATYGNSLAQVSTPLVYTATVHMSVRRSFRPC